MDEEIQVNIKEPEPGEETSMKIRPLERITLYPKAPIEPAVYSKNYSRPWILQDGRPAPGPGSEMRNSYKVPKIYKHGEEGIRQRMLRDFYWEQVLDEVIEDLAMPQPVAEYCSEYDSNYVKDDFEPRNLEETADRNMHLRYPLYGTGSSAITFYSETIKKTGPGEILEKFRRCQYFTKPMEERLDNGWVL